MVRTNQYIYVLATITNYYYMRFFVYCLALLLTGCFDQQTKTGSADPIKIDSSWKKKTINYVLTVSLPDTAIPEQINGYIRSNYSQGKSGFYRVNRYDTIFRHVTNEAEFRRALKEYVAVQFTHEELIPCDLTVRDTMIGNSAGYFITGYASLTDTIKSCKYPFFYLTIANNNYYWFGACQSSPEMTDETKQFFRSIQFNQEYFKESEYRLPPTRIHKDADSATVRAVQN